MDYQKIGSFIKEQRKKLKLTQKELAKELGITDRAVSRWERGLGCPDISLLEKISNIFNVSVLEIIKGEKKENNDISNDDILFSMNITKTNITDNIKRAITMFTIISVIIFFVYITVGTIKSINMLNKRYSHYYEEGYILEIKNNYNEYNTKLNMIKKSNGILNIEDYNKIISNLEQMSNYLEKQKNDLYLESTSYTFKDLLQFYVDHNNIYTMNINNLDLYKILLKYDISLSENMIKYNNDKEKIDREMTFQSFFLIQPYSSKPVNQINPTYIPDVYYIINLIYEREVMLLDDIIKVGEIDEKN